MEAGTVELWLDEEGWGVIGSVATPNGCWVPFSAVVMDGYRRLVPGDRVTFTYEQADQDGYSFRALEVWPPGVEPGTRMPPSSSPNVGAYKSRLTITLDDGTVLSADETRRRIERATPDGSAE